MDAIGDAWEPGSYSVFARHYLPMAARLVEATAVGPDDAVLDVGCGTGNVAITAARSGADVTGLDVTPAMLERARANAERAGVDGIDLYEGDATELPFDEDAFDVTLSALGHVYGDPPDDAARELLRVTRPGGRIGFTSWKPTNLFPIVAGHVMTHLHPADRPEFTEPPFVWGDRDIVEQRLGPDVEDLSFETGKVLYPALSPTQFWEELTTHSGLFATFLDDIHDRSKLRGDVVETIRPYFDPAENVIELECLRSTATVTRSG